MAGEKMPGLKVSNIIFKISPCYFLPTEVEVLWEDSFKAKERLGWTLKMTLDTIIKERLAYELNQARQHTLLKIMTLMLLNVNNQLIEAPSYFICRSTLVLSFAKLTHQAIVLMLNPLNYMKVILSIDPVRFPLTGIGRYTYELAKHLKGVTEVEQLNFLSGFRFTHFPEQAEASNAGSLNKLRQAIFSSPLTRELYD
jgi:hypothetical protein